MGLPHRYNTSFYYYFQSYAMKPFHLYQLSYVVNMHQQDPPKYYGWVEWGLPSFSSGTEGKSMIRYKLHETTELKHTDPYSYVSLMYALVIFTQVIAM